MKLRTAMQCTAAIAIFGVGAMDATADKINYSFSTTVDFSTFTTVQTGEAFTISYSVDTAIPGSGSTTFADFNNVSNMAMAAGSFSATSAPGLLRQLNDPSLDQYLVYSGAPVGSLEGLELVYFLFEGFDPTGKAISDALTVLEDPSLFTFNGFWAVFALGDVGGVIHGHIDRPTTVPEPTTLALLGIGLAGLGFARRKR